MADLPVVPPSPHGAYNGQPPANAPLPRPFQQAGQLHPPREVYTIEFFLDVPTPRDADNVNIANLHHEFAQALFAIDDSLTIYPTAQQTTPFKPLISRIDDFPNSDSEHRSFFHHYSMNRNRKIRIVMKITAPMNLAKIKKAIYPTLQRNRLWITNDSLPKQEIS